MVRNYTWHIAGIVFFLFVFFIAYYLGLFEAVTLTTLQQNASALYFFVQRYFVFSVFIFCALFTTATFLFLPITVLLTLAAGFLFGVSIGTLLVLLSATCGGAIMLLVVRYAIGNRVQEKYADALQMFNDDIKKYGSSYLLMLQLLPITPTFAINLFAGVIPISLWTYMWTTAVGILPGTLIYAIAGRQLHVIKSLNDLMSWPAIIILCLLALLALLPMIVRRYVMK